MNQHDEPIFREAALIAHRRGHRRGSPLQIHHRWAHRSLVVGVTMMVIGFGSAATVEVRDQVQAQAVVSLDGEAQLVSAQFPAHTRAAIERPDTELFLVLSESPRDPVPLSRPRLDAIGNDRISLSATVANPGESPALGDGARGKLVARLGKTTPLAEAISSLRDGD